MRSLARKTSELNAVLNRPALLLALFLMTGGLGKSMAFFWVQADDPGRILQPDSASYVDTARAIVQTGRFAISPQYSETPQVERTPGYPALIAGGFYLWGDRYTPLILIQICLSLVTIWTTYAIAASFWGRRTALIPAGLLSLDILSFIYSQQVTTETLFTCILTLAILFGIRSLGQVRHRSLLILGHGLLLAFATLIRPAAYYVIFPELLLFLCFWKLSLKYSWKKTLQGVLLLTLPWGLLIGGWQIRNYYVAGSAEFSAIQGVNLLFYRGAGIVAERDNISFGEARRRLGYEEYKIAKFSPDSAERSLGKLSRDWKREGARLIRQHPGIFLSIQLQGAIRMMLETDWNILPTYFSGEYTADSGPAGDLLRLPFSVYIQTWVLDKTGYFFVFAAAASYVIILYSGVIIALWRIVRHQRQKIMPHALIWTVLLYIIVISAGPEAYSRFRVPIMPFLSLYGGYGLSVFIQRIGGYLRTSDSRPV